MTERALKSLRVPVKQLRRECNPAVFKFRTTAELAPIEGTVGQDRAVTAMDFGLTIEADGYNLYVAGPTGTGRTTELRTQLAKVAVERPAQVVPAHMATKIVAEAQKAREAVHA